MNDRIYKTLQKISTYPSGTLKDSTSNGQVCHSSDLIITTEVRSLQNSMFTLLALLPARRSRPRAAFPWFDGRPGSRPGTRLSSRRPRSMARAFRSPRPGLPRSTRRRIGIFSDGGQGRWLGWTLARPSVGDGRAGPGAAFPPGTAWPASTVFPFMFCGFFLAVICRAVSEPLPLPLSGLLVVFHSRTNFLSLLLLLLTSLSFFLFCFLLKFFTKKM